MWPMTRLPSFGCVYMLCTMVFIQWLPLHTHGSCRDPLTAAAVTPTGARKKDAARAAPDDGAAIAVAAVTALSPRRLPVSDYRHTLSHQVDMYGFTSVLAKRQ